MKLKEKMINRDLFLNEKDVSDVIKKVSRFIKIIEIAHRNAGKGNLVFK